MDTNETFGKPFGNCALNNIHETQHSCFFYYHLWFLLANMGVSLYACVCMYVYVFVCVYVYVYVYVSVYVYVYVCFLRVSVCHILCS